MILSRPEPRWLITGLGASLVFCLLPAAPAATNPPATTEFVLPATPPVPELRSPVALFRELLAMSSSEQKVYLADRSTEHQKRILAKVREYESLRPNQRELRLRATELQWYLSPLLVMSATNRAARLALIPAEQHQLVEGRLREWDKLPATAQKELLENEATLRYFTQIEPATEEQKQAVLKTLSPARREKLEAGIAHWQRLPEEQRRKTLDRFNRFFELTPAEKEKSLGSLSDEERRQMEKTLRRFDQLPAAQRVECIKAFDKFTALSLEERQQFLKNAERWRLMSPDERQGWRELVQKLPPTGPPLPPGFNRHPTPPLPPGVSILPASAVATNSRK